MFPGGGSIGRNPNWQPPMATYALGGTVGFYPGNLVREFVMPPDPPPPPKRVIIPPAIEEKLQQGYRDEYERRLAEQGERAMRGLGEHMLPKTRARTEEECLEKFGVTVSETQAQARLAWRRFLACPAWRRRRAARLQQEHRVLAERVKSMITFMAQRVPVEGGAEGSSGGG